MKTQLFTFTFLLFVCTNIFGQAFEKLKISKEELPKEYELTQETQCQAIQSCLFYKQTDIYSSFLGKVKAKEIQNFKSKKDSGSIMYFEFGKDFEGQGFLEGLLWGQSDKPTKEHPEEFLIKGKILIIYSFKKESEMKKLSQNKVNLVLE